MANTTNKAVAGIDLAQLFGAAAQALIANQGSLNSADAGNGNHGDNMVQMFQLITDAIGATKGKTPAQQLSYASKMLTQNATSGSSRVYAQGLSQAAEQFQGQKKVTPEAAMTLVQTLLGGGQAPTSPSNSGMDMLGQLLGGMQSNPNSSKNDGLDLGDVLSAGMAFMQAKQSGQDNMQAAVSALLSGSPLSQQPHRAQSGEVVANALLQAISAFSQK